MKMIKFALLGTAALAAVTVSARASELSDLKAQIEALNARFDAQSAIPAGYQLMQVGRADAIVIPSLEIDPMAPKTAMQFGIVPAADMPATTVIQWSGNVKAALTHSNTTWYDRTLNTNGTAPDTTSTSTYSGAETQVKAKWGLKVVGTTDTAVGEVGVKIAFAGNAQTSHSSYAGNANWNTASSISGDGFWGWWKMTPEMTLGAGRDGSLSGNGEGFDGQASANFAGGDANGGYGLGDVAQFRLSYASGPIAAAIALEDGDSNNGSTGIEESHFGVSGEVKFSGDSFGVEVNAGVQNTGSFHPEDAWTVNAGAHFALGDMVTLSGAAGMGSGVGTTDDYTKASLFAKVALTDAARAEFGVSHKWNTQAPSTDGDATSFGGGLYYTPVSQLTIGFEADYTFANTYIGDMGAMSIYGVSGTQSATNAALVTVFSF